MQVQSDGRRVVLAESREAFEKAFFDRFKDETEAEEAIDRFLKTHKLVIAPPRKHFDLKLATGKNVVDERQINID